MKKIIILSSVCAAAVGAAVCIAYKTGSLGATKTKATQLIKDCKRKLNNLVYPLSDVDDLSEEDLSGDASILCELLKRGNISEE